MTAPFVLVLLAALLGGASPLGKAAASASASAACYVPLFSHGRGRRGRGPTVVGAPRPTSARHASGPTSALTFIAAGSLGWGCAGVQRATTTTALLHRDRLTFRKTERRCATVYAPPWEGSESDVADRSFDDDEFDSSSSANKDEDDEHHHRAALKSLISRTEASEAMLARLAVAFSPASRSLDLRDIEHVQLLEVDNKHLDIQAVVCEDDGCVTLKVPVTFPVPCLVGDADVEEEDEEHCVLDNLQRLDLQAQETIRKLEWNELHHEDVAAEHRMHRELLREATGGGGGDDALHFPTWWVHLSSTDDIMRRECDSLRKLLNDDEFRSAVASMATQAMDAAAVSDDDDNDDDEEEEELSSMSYDDFHVTQAVVAAVCPKGLLLRAAVAPLEILGEHSHDNARGHVLEIPIQFSTNAANTADELQSAVLALVDAAEEYGG